MVFGKRGLPCHFNELDWLSSARCVRLPRSHTVGIRWSAAQNATASRFHVTSWSRRHMVWYIDRHSRNFLTNKFDRAKTTVAMSVWAKPKTRVGTSEWYRGARLSSRLLETVTPAMMLFCAARFFTQTNTAGWGRASGVLVLTERLLPRIGAISGAMIDLFRYTAV